MVEMLGADCFDQAVTDLVYRNSWISTERCGASVEAANGLPRMDCDVMMGARCGFQEFQYCTEMVDGELHAAANSCLSIVKC